MTFSTLILPFSHSSFGSVDAVIETVEHWVSRIEVSRRPIAKMSKQLEWFVDNINPKTTSSQEVKEKCLNFIKEAVNCHLRPQIEFEEAEKCLLCRTHDQLMLVDDAISDKTRGGGSLTLPEVVELAICLYAKQAKFHQEIAEAAYESFKKLDALKRQVKANDIYLAQIMNLVATFDELSMAKARLEIYDMGPGNETKSDDVRTGIKRIPRHLVSIQGLGRSFSVTHRPHIFLCRLARC